ncbi:hypothetical protein ACFW3Z_09145 [Nocardiopsis alba]|uniref:hypothetical protein n=1 Tax=Nocardiopsis alba TaxID=53437 RepID=UPI0033A2C1E2
MSDNESGTGEEVPPDRLGAPQENLLDRLVSGVGSVAKADRVAYATGNDGRAWKNSRLLAELRRVNNGHVSARGRAELPGACRALAELFSESSSEYLIRAMLHRPEHLLGVVLPRLLDPQTVDGEKDSPEDRIPRTSEASALHVWSVFTVCMEVLWEHVSGKEGSAHRHLEPLAARTRFLALSEPFRHHPDDSNWEEYWRGDTLLHLFGDSDTTAPLIRRAREARDIWRGYLNRHQSLPLFDHASPLAIEEEIRWLAFQEGKSRWPFSGGPLALSAPDIEEKENESLEIAAPLPTAADKAVLVDVVERHLLPRFAVGATWSAVWGLYRPPVYHRALVAYVTAALGLALVIAFFSAILMPFMESVSITFTLLAIGVCYLLIGFGTLIHGRAWAMPLFLRIPAAGAVGLIVLVAFHPDWWKNVTWGWGLISALVVLGGVSFGYLLIEARNHNTGMISDRGWTPFVLAVRALSVTITGLVHSLFVAVVGMITLTTVFGEDNNLLREVWAGTSDLNVSPSAILTAATFWCLAAGVFSQILWDDQPITAPLSHRRWRDER